MQQDYQEVADKLYEALEEAVALFRQRLTRQGIRVHHLPEEPMAVEIASFVLLKCLVKERLALNHFVTDEEQAYQEAYHLIKEIVIKYRSTDLFSPQKH